LSLTRQQSPEYSAVLFLPRPDTHTQTLPTMTLNSGLIILRSSSARAALSSAVVRCNLRCTTAEANCSLISLWL
jgi:hypothetical protein